ncbi:MAG: hypothetical protein WC654_07235 [Patescibacteria group bacterium]
MKITSPTHSYEVGDQVAEASGYNLYLCKQEGTGRQCLLQVAVDVTGNGALDRAAFLLKELKRRADELEAEYEKVKKDPKSTLNYDLGFPELVDSFVSEEQGGRRINILAFRNVEDVSRMVPIGNIVEKDRQRVDLRTSAWVMGKSLKLLAFAHGMGISIKRVDTTNILIEPDQHYVVFFDLSEAETYSDGMVPGEQRGADIAQAAQAVIAILGGDYESMSIPDDDDGKYKRYTDHLLGLAGGSQHDAHSAHTRFYELVDELWEHGFYPFTTYNL